MSDLDQKILIESKNPDALLELDSLLKKLNSTPIGRRAFLQAVPLLMAACASKSANRHREGDNSGQVTSLTPEDEKKMTEEVLPQMKKDYPAVNNPELQNYISKLGNRIVLANNLNRNPYQYNFTVVDVNYVNAFALPAGTVFVTAPLIAMAETESELAGVVGHEIGHIQARHTAERMELAKKEQPKTWLFAAGGGLLGGAAGFGLGRLLCPPKDKECLAKATVVGAAAGAGGGLLIQKYKFMANSREDEMEADRVGFKTAYNAQFSKDHIGLFYEKLLKMEQQSKGGEQNGFLASLQDAMSTHPPSKERVAQMNEMSQNAANKAGSIISSKEFEKFKKVCVELSKA